MKVSRFISVAILVCFCILSMQAHQAEQTKQVQQTCQAKQVGLKTICFIGLLLPLTWD